MLSFLTPKKFSTPTTSAVLFIIFLGLFLAYPVFATEYKPLVGIPGLPSDSTRTLSGYVNTLYLLTVTIGALLAFLKITFAGVKYAMSDVITDKASAKQDIKGALFGLAILLLPFLVLSTIYGGLVNLNILGNAEPFEVRKPASGNSSVRVGGTACAQLTDFVIRRDCLNREACALQKGTYDSASQHCTLPTTTQPTPTTPTSPTPTPGPTTPPPTASEKTFYSNSELGKSGNEINAEWRTRCGDKLRVEPGTKDGVRGRYYSCAS